MAEPSTGPSSYAPPFSLLMDQIRSWEGCGNGEHIVQHAANGTYTYRDANRILTNDCGEIAGDVNGATSHLLDDRATIYARLHEKFLSNYGVDKLPPEIQAQMFDFGINAGTGRAVQKLELLLAKKGYLHASGRTHVDDEIRGAAQKYLGDVGMIEFNNEYAAVRVNYYESIAEHNPEKAINLNGWRRRASGFIMDGSASEYKANGFKVDAKGHVFLPDQVKGADGKPAVKMPDGSLVNYDKWYWTNVLQPADNRHAKFDDRKQKTIHYSGHHVAGTDSNNPGDYVSPVDEQNWLPEDRALYQLLYGLLSIVFGLFKACGAQVQSAPVNPGEEPTHNLPAVPQRGNAPAIPGHH